MISELILRPAEPTDFDFCQRIYFASMSPIIGTLRLDMARQHESFAQQWHAAEVRIITVASKDVGWLQTAPATDAIFVAQLCLEERFQRQGIGSRVMRTVIEEAAREGKAVTLGVVKINPARRLYERLGFSVTHEDQYKYYMRRECAVSNPP
jgi:ribosomal protein S18 acetylase RimI-like enzyme